MFSFIYRPLGPWTGKLTELRKPSGAFSAGWVDTKNLLCREVEQLGGRSVVIQVDVTAEEIRQDGQLRSRSNIAFPGVKVSFESEHGPLTYATDAYEKRYANSMPGWQANVRAVALGLQALRAVDRYGISGSGEQYRGFTALDSKPFGQGPMTADDAISALLQTTGIDVTREQLLTDDKAVARAFRSAARRYHPDAGGDQSIYLKIVKARDVLLGNA